MESICYVKLIRFDRNKSGIYRVNFLMTELEIENVLNRF